MKKTPRQGMIRQTMTRQAGEVAMWADGPDLVCCDFFPSLLKVFFRFMVLLFSTSALLQPDVFFLTPSVPIGVTTCPNDCCPLDYASVHHLDEKQRSRMESLVFNGFAYSLYNGEYKTDYYNTNVKNRLLHTGYITLSGVKNVALRYDTANIPRDFGGPSCHRNSNLFPDIGCIQLTGFELFISSCRLIMNSEMREKRREMFEKNKDQLRRNPFSYYLFSSTATG